MWKRFIRALRALFGGMVSAIEDPKLVLEQNIRDLNDQVPKMNESIATVKASVTLLEKDHQRIQNEYDNLTSKMRAAIAQGRDDIAANYAMRVQTLKSQLERTSGELEVARRAYEKALEVKKAFMRERERKIQEARDALREHERSKWQKKIADTLEQFEVGGVDQTHDEMVRRVNEMTAKNEARIEMALDSVDTKSIKLEEEAEQLRAKELVQQMKMEMGINVASGAPASSETTQEDAGMRTREGLL
ncbi:MAG: PspA/IM30 family protein [Bacteroidia bacterium]|nr:PspA/IM30 family protein [Bacteroidia bacterium]